MADTFLKLEHISKNFGDIHAVSDLSLTVFPREIYTLIGPNGSGKTTTVKMITGLYQPTAGAISISLMDLAKQAEKAKSVVGYIPDEPFVYERMTGREFLSLVGVLYGVSKDEQKQRIPELLKIYD